jgi:hypothetical protein
MHATGRTPHVGIPPQSEAEIAPHLSALRRLDPLLDLRWNAQAFVRSYGGFDAFGRALSPTYEGRWEVIRYDSATALHDRAYTVILTVTAIDPTDRGGLMQDRGPYAPIGEWLVTYLQRFDAAQRHFIAEMDRAWAAHDAAEAAVDADERAGHQEALEKVYREHGGGEYWMGRGFGRGTARATPSLTH